MKTRPIRLLIVDDLESWRYSLRLQFKQRTDITISEAVNGDDALEKLKVEHYDLVLLDLKMPSHTEGLNVLSDIKKLRPQTQVIMMTSYGDIPTAVEAMRRGALDFVSKGADFDDIIKFKADEFIRTAHLISDRELLIRAKYNEAVLSTDSHKKGKALEVLLAALLSSVEGFFVIGRNQRTITEEIDIVIRNESRDPIWHKESDIILVECKNWSSERIGKNEYVVFENKIKNRYSRCKLGILVCTGNFSNTLRKEMLRSSKTDILIVPVNGKDLRQLVNAESRSQVLRSFVDKAILT